MIQRLDVLVGDAEVQLGSGEADIFRVHRMILEDGTFQERLFEAIEGRGLSAEDAVQSQLDLYQKELLAADSEYLRQRVADFTEIQQGLLDRLRRAKPSLCCREMAHCNMGQCRLGNDHILVANELVPSLVIDMDCHTVGFLVEKGGPTAHAAILARALQLPAVSGIENLPAAIPLESEILINGDTGEVILNPSEQTLARHRRALAHSRCHTLQIHGPISELTVMANIECAAGVRDALAARAEGIGLYRTEIEALAEGRLLSEAEQAARYSEVVRAMGEKPVYIRLLDLGADKAAAWLGMPQEDNPALGCRGARLLLARPEILWNQARALARASVQGPIHVVYPMIIDADQFRRVRALFEAAVADLNPSNLRHGVMFEVPSACLQARQILQEADFGCIGTNDLIQYLFATDRSNEGIACDARPDHPVLWFLIEEITRAARETGKPMSICGECAGNPALIQKILEAGLTIVSTSTRQIARLRRAARRNRS